jgi:phenylacetate-CoA ligase
MNVEALYQRLPVPLQEAVCSIEGWRIRHHRYNARFHQLLREYEHRARAPHQAIEELRNGRLFRFLHFCVREVPYYSAHVPRDLLPARPEESFVALAEWPMLTKDQVKADRASFRARSITEPVLTVHTSGTTGSGFHFEVTREAAQEQWAVWWRYRRSHGIPLDAWCGYFGARSLVPIRQTSVPYWRTNFPGRQLMFSAYHMGPLTVDSYLKELERRRPVWLHGYPSVLALLAAHMLESDQRLSYQVRWITTGAENLLAGQRRQIEAAFGVRPCQHYGITEGVANFSECERRTLHVDEDYAAVEFVPHSADADRVIGTNFTNPAMPLVRYDVGDFVTRRQATCECGRPGRLVHRVDGRQEDYVVLPSGASIGRLDHAFKDLVTVREAQIVQPSPDRLVVYVVPGQGHGPIEDERIMQELKSRLGDGLLIQIQHVERIARTAGGKLRFVISDVKPSLATA